MDENIIITVDFTNLEALRKVMDEHHGLDTMLTGANQDGERVTLSIFADRIVATTYQDNHWVRVNTAWRDGTLEETFDGKW